MYPAFCAGDKAVGWGAFHEKDVTGYYGSFAEDGIASQDGAVGINDNVIFYGGMTLNVFNGASVFVEWKAFGSKGHALIELDVVTDVRGFANHDAGAVVDEKAATNAGAGMDIDAGE